MPELYSLPLISTVLACYAGAAVLLMLTQLYVLAARWHAGGSLWRRGDMIAVLEDSCSLLWMSTLFAAPAIWDSLWDRTRWMELAVVLAVTGVLMQVSSALCTRRIARLQAIARLNANIPLDAPTPPPVPVDWNMERHLALLWVPALLVYVGGVFAIVWIGKPVGWPALATILLSIAWLLAIPLLIIFGRYPGRITQRHSLVIEATPQQVWETLHCRATDNYYRASTARIEHVPGTENQFAWYSADVGPCSMCGLPRTKDQGSQTRMLVDVVEEVAGRRARQLTTFPPEVPLAARLHWREDSHFEIRSHADGAEIYYEVNAFGSRLWVAGLMLVGNVPRDLLQDLKSYLEGTRGKGVFASAREHRQFAETSHFVCGCTT